MVSSSKPFVVAVGLLFFWHTKLTVIAFQFPNPFKRADVPVGIPAPLSLSAPAEAMVRNPCYRFYSVEFMSVLTLVHADQKRVFALLLFLLVLY